MPIEAAAPLTQEAKAVLKLEGGTDMVNSSRLHCIDGTQNPCPGATLLSFNFEPPEGCIIRSVVSS